MKNFILTVIISFFALHSNILHCQDTTYSNRTSWWESELEYRELAGVKLKKRADGYFKSDYQSNTKWLESYPGILSIENINWPHNTELHFYNKDKKLLNILSLEKLNPFLEIKDVPISKGGYNFEHHDVAPKKLLAKGVQPTELLTLFYGAQTNKRNGITIAHYSLTALHENLLIDLKTAILVIDRNGKTIHTHIMNDSAYGVLTSDDGKLIAYSYGGIVQNPLTKSELGECRVYDFTKGKVVLTIRPMENRRINTVVSAEKDSLVLVGYAKLDRSHDDIRYIDLIDLNTRMRYFKGFKDKELIGKWDEYNTYRKMIKLNEFNINSF